MTVNKLTAKRNKLVAHFPHNGDQEFKDLCQEKIVHVNEEIEHWEGLIIEQNTPILYEEILNLRDGVGDGYEDMKHGANPRYYSVIKGIKYLIWKGEGRIEVVVTSPAGFLILEYGTIDNVEYTISFIEADSFSSELDY